MLTKWSNLPSTILGQPHIICTLTQITVYNMTYEMLLPKMLEDTIKQTQDMTVGLDSSNKSVSWKKEKMAGGYLDLKRQINITTKCNMWPMTVF